MSTRAHVAFYEDPARPLRLWNALVYRHDGGRPEDMLPELQVFAADFEACRGLGYAENASAWYLMLMFKQHLKRAEDFLRARPGGTGAVRSKVFPELGGLGLYMGFGVAEGFHGDVEFLYAVYPDRIEAYRVVRDDLVLGQRPRRRTMDGFVLELMESLEIS